MSTARHLSSVPHEKEAAIATRDDDMREFLIVVRRALLLIVRWIEKRYCL